MENLIMKIPSAEDAGQISDFRREMLKMNSSMNGCGSLRRTEDPLEWLETVKMKSKKETCGEKYVVSTQFICVRKSDNKLVGMIQLRHHLNDHLREYGGHIGYSVRPSERRKGYAKYMLKNCLAYAKELGLDKVMISCEDNNEASRKTILAFNGKYEGTVFEPDEKINLEKYWIEI